jgi:hypothetical protein
MRKRDVADARDLEQENRELAQQQVRKINDTLRKVRRISRDSHKSFKAAQEAFADLTPATGFHMMTTPVVEEVTIRVDPPADPDDTSRFCIPEPSAETTVSAALTRAFEILEQEKRNFQPAVAPVPVVRRWKIA